MLTIPQAAALVGRSPETLRRWVRSGRLGATKIGTQHMIDEADLARVIQPRGALVAESTVAYGDDWLDDERPPSPLLRRIGADPRVLVGRPVIKGTRISVGSVLDLLAAGWTYEMFSDQFPGLSADDIRACIAYAAHVVGEERVYSLPKR